jgi:hypothetical protein
MKGKFWIFKVAKVLVLITVFLAVLGLLVMKLWNWLVPSLFMGPVVSYWEALGLLVLVRVLCGGFRPHGHGGGPFGHWRHRREVWKQMTPEQRDEFRSRMRERWGRGCMPGRSAEKGNAE